MAESLPEIPFPPEVQTDADEVLFWERAEKRLRDFCDPLSRSVRPKNIAHAAQISTGQLSKEISGTDDKHLSAIVLLFIVHKTKHHELLRYIVCDLFGCKSAELQQPPSLQEENERLRAENVRLKAAIRAANEIAQPAAEPALRAVSR